MRFVCLVYHRVANDRMAALDPHVVSPAHLRTHMTCLARWGYTGVSLSTALRPGETGGLRPIALSFDDGYLDFYTTAWPILREFGFSATVFVVTEATGQIACWARAPAVPLMGWDHVQALAAAGIEIGAHGATHRPLDTVPPSEMHRELSAAYQDLSRQLDRPPAGVAYPYGRCSTRVAVAAQAAGFCWGCTARGGINIQDHSHFKIRRALVHSRVSRLRFAIQVWTGYAHWVEWGMDLRGIP